MSERKPNPREQTDSDGKAEIDVEDLSSEFVTDPDKSDITAELKLRGAFADALEGTEFGNAIVLPLEAAHELTKPHHERIITYLRNNEVDSVRDLARDLDMDHGNVSRHLDELMSYDVIEMQENGRSKVPRLKHEHVVFDPLF